MQATIPARAGDGKKHIAFFHLATRKAQITNQHITLCLRQKPAQWHGH